MSRDNKYLTKVVAASLLGDASVSRLEGPNSNSCFEIVQRSDHQDYLEYLGNKLQDITSLKITSPCEACSKEQKIIIQGVETTARPKLRLRTSRHPFFTKFRERMYGTGRKSVDPHYLTLLDWEFLAQWYQEDGWYSSTYQPKSRATITKLALSTSGFTYGEHVILRQALKEKLDLTWNIQKFNRPSGVLYRLELYKKQIPEFMEGVYKYIVPSFEYKIARMVNPSKEEGDDTVQTVQECAEQNGNISASAIAE